MGFCFGWAAAGSSLKQLKDTGCGDELVSDWLFEQNVSGMSHEHRP